MRTEPAMPRWEELRTHSEISGSPSGPVCAPSHVPPAISVTAQRMPSADARARAGRDDHGDDRDDQQQRAEVLGGGLASGAAGQGSHSGAGCPRDAPATRVPGPVLGLGPGRDSAGTAGAAPDVDDLAHRGGAPGDPGVQRAQDELEAAGLELLELLDERVEAPALLVDLARCRPGRCPSTSSGASTARWPRTASRVVWASPSAAHAMWRPGRTPRRGGAGRRSRSRSVRTQMIVLRSAAARAATRRGRRRRRRRAPSRGRTARRRGRSPARAAWRCARRTPRPALGAGRKWKMPPPSLSISTITSFRPRRDAASSPPTSCASATSPISSTVSPRTAAATPNAVETVPSIPFAPRLESTRNGVSRAGKNVSTSRIGIEDATTSVASGGQQRAELGRDPRLVEPRGPDDLGDRARRRPVGARASRRARTCPCACAAACPRASRASRAGRRRRSWRRRRPGPARRTRGRTRPAARPGPRATGAAAWRSGGRRRAGRGPARAPPPSRGRAAARRSARSRPARGGRRRSARPAAARRPRSAKAATAAARRGSRSARPATTIGLRRIAQLVLEADQQPLRGHAHRAAAASPTGARPRGPGRSRRPAPRHRRARAARAARSSGAPGRDARRSRCRTRGRRAGAASAARAARRRMVVDLEVPLGGAAVELDLVDRLPGADVAQLGRPVGGQHEQRHARLVRLDHGGRVVGGGGARGAGERGGDAGRLGQAEREEARRCARPGGRSRAGRRGARASARAASSASRATCTRRAVRSARARRRTHAGRGRCRFRA